MSLSFDLLADRLGASQDGAVARFQLLALGANDAQIQRRRRSGRLLSCHPGVYLLSGHADTPARRLVAAGLAVGPGAVLSHETAAAWFGFTGYPVGPTVSTLPAPTSGYQASPCTRSPTSPIGGPCRGVHCASPSPSGSSSTSPP